MNRANQKAVMSAFQFAGLVIERCMQCSVVLALTLYIPWTRWVGRWFYATLGGQGEINGIDAVSLWFTFMWIFILMKFIEGVLTEALK